jgi:Zinc finger, C2H2 type
MQHKWIVEHVCDPAKQKQVKKLEKFIKVELQKCDRCNQEFSNADAFDCHKFSVCLTDPIFMCVECGKECVDQHRLNLHKRVHDNQKFICDDCGQCFASEVGGACKQFDDFVFNLVLSFQSGLLRHKVVHIYGRSFVCDQCSATFIDKKALNHHSLVHQERRYECDLCGKKFRTFDSVKMHMVRFFITR